jgi:N-acetylneuraminic acid mutarotase
LNTGATYDSGTDSWMAISLTNAPEPRTSHTAVWTDSEMIVWGGDDGRNGFGDGARYSPSTNTWTATSTSNAPEARSGHTAIWTGTEMIVWGGVQGTNAGPIYFATGGRYNPEADTWTDTGNINAPGARSSHTAVWADSEMIVWGGDPVFFVSGGRYCVKGVPPPTPTPTPSPTPMPTGTPTPTPSIDRCGPTPRPRPTPHPRPTTP